MSPPQSPQARNGDSPDPASHAVTIYDPEGEWVDEEEDIDDDDMEYEPTTEDSEDIEFFETEDDDGEFHDAEDGLSGVEIEFALNDTGSGTQDDETAGEQTETEGQESSTATTQAAPVQNIITVSRNQILQLLGYHGARHLFGSHAGSGRGASADDDDDEEDGGYGRSTRRSGRRTKASKDEFPKVPSEFGRQLMDSGTFGSNEYYLERLKRRKTKLASRLMRRELGLESDARRKRFNMLMAQGMIPSSKADTIIHYNARCYSGQFSDDGNFFFSCAQDFKVRLYDTSNPYKWRYYKTVVYPYGQWTITDASLSPDNKYIAYSSIRSIVCLAPTDPGESGEPWLLDFSDMGGRSRRGFGGYSHFGIWSIRFSGDGREIVAGTSDRSVYVYDIETRKSILRIAAHEDDVNAVCFGDTSSPHILYSGSDDTTIKVWDRRSMGDSREAGVFMGHTEGLTYVDSKGDGRYVLSNGKDQMMKLWDLRKMMPTEKFDRIDPNRFSTGFDYRFMPYRDEDYRAHPHDCSLVTFRGHRVLKTLIRCHFSPPGSTNSRYVYSGSEDGSVYIYNLDATLAGKVDVNHATHHSRPRDPDLYTSSYEMGGRSRGAWKTCVRDASWHPNAPVIAATSWNGWGMSTGTCTLHSWNDGAADDEGEPKMGMRVNERLEYDEDLYDSPRTGGAGTTGTRSFMRSRLRSRRVAALEDDDEGEEGEGW